MLTSLQSRVQYTANGTTTAFAVPFLFYDAAHLVVIDSDPVSGVDTTAVLNTDYMVTGMADPSGGTVTFNAAPLNGHIITIDRSVPMTQPDQYENDGDLSGDQLEKDLDLGVMRSQQISDELSRTMVTPISDAPTLDMTLPNAFSRAGKLLSFDASGKPSLSVPGTADTVMNSGKLLGRTSAGTGLPEEIAPGTGISLSANQIALAAMAANSIKGNNTGASALPIDLTISQVQSMLGFSGFSRMTVITSSGNWTVPAGVVTAKLTLIGGGGGGGGKAATANLAAGGGTSGAICIGILTGLTPGSNVAFVIGAAGSGAASGANAGGSGGATSQGTLTAAGGIGGVLGNTGVVITSSVPTASNGTVNIPGKAGAPGFGLSSPNIGGSGGDCPFGSPGLSGLGAGQAAQGFGAGGSGGAGTAATALAGGSGAPGAVIIEY